jgi:hypothetical protein
MTRVLLSSPSIADDPGQADEGEPFPPISYPFESHELVRSQINWRRGFFRLWIVASALYVIVVTAINFSDIKTSVVNFYHTDWTSLVGARYVPVRCTEAQGVMGRDFTLRAEDFNICWYDLPKFRSRHPEYTNQSDAELEAKLYAAVERSVPPYPWPTLLNWIAIVLGIPLDALIVGAAIGWACSGFKSRTSTTSGDLFLSR